MNTGKAGQIAAAPEIFGLVEQDLTPWSSELALESVASVEAVTRIAPLSAE